MTLADVAEPLTLADGTRIDPVNGAIVADVTSYEAVPTNTVAVEAVQKANRKAAELPDLPSRMNPISAVLSYELFGLDITQTAIASGFTVDQVTNIRMLEAYTDMKSSVVDSIRQEDVETVRSYVNQHAIKAAQSIVGLVDSDDTSVRLSASKDILDRAGHRPADIVEHRHKMDGGLVIEHVKRDTKAELPIIEHEVIQDGDS